MTPHEAAFDPKAVRAVAAVTLTALKCVEICGARVAMRVAGRGLIFKIGREEGWPEKAGSRVTWARADFRVNLHRATTSAADAEVVYDAWEQFVKERNGKISSYDIKSSGPPEVPPPPLPLLVLLLVRRLPSCPHSHALSLLRAAHFALCRPQVRQTSDLWVRMVLELHLMSGVLGAIAISFTTSFLAICGFTGNIFIAFYCVTTIISIVITLQVRPSASDQVADHVAAPALSAV